MTVQHNTLTGNELHIPFKYGLNANKAASPNEGEWYWSTDTNTMYQCKSAGSWIEWTEDMGGFKIPFDYGTDASKSATPDVGHWYFATDTEKIYYCISDDSWSEFAASNSYTTSFDDGDLTAGVLTVNHTLGTKYVVAEVYDDNDKKILPDEVELTDSDNCDIDLSSFGTISGTWHVRVVA